MDIINEISEDEDKVAYSIMFNHICNIEIGFRYPIRYGSNIKIIMEKLKKIAERRNDNEQNIYL